MAAVATQLPWVEKYRPKSVDEVSHQPEVVASLKKSLEQKNLPCAGAIPRSRTADHTQLLATKRQLI